MTQVRIRHSAEPSAAWAAASAFREAACTIAWGLSSRPGTEALLSSRTPWTSDFLFVFAQHAISGIPPCTPAHSGLTCSRGSRSRTGSDHSPPWRDFHPTVATPGSSLHPITHLPPSCAQRLTSWASISPNGGFGPNHWPCWLHYPPVTSGFLNDSCQIGLGLLSFWFLSQPPWPLP